MNNTKQAKIAVFPGSFDPITVGHQSIILRALPLFDKIIVAIGVNTLKNNMFSVEQRKHFIEKVFAGEAKIEVRGFTGLTVDFCRSVNARYILRGLRTSADFEFERSIGQVNKMLDSNIENIFMLTSTNHTPITASIVRDVLRHGGKVNGLVPPVIIDELSNK